MCISDVPSVLPCSTTAACRLMSRNTDRLRCPPLSDSTSPSRSTMPRPWYQSHHHSFIHSWGCIVGGGSKVGGEGVICREEGQDSIFLSHCYHFTLSSLINYSFVITLFISACEFDLFISFDVVVPVLSNVMAEVCVCVPSLLPGGVGSCQHRLWPHPGWGPLSVPGRNTGHIHVPHLSCF